MKLLLNMNLPRDLGVQIDKIGHECRHVGDMGMTRSADQDIITVARASSETILTHDLDYGELLAFSGERYPSVVVFRMRDICTGNLVKQIANAWPHISGALEQGAVIILGDNSIRIRRLPIEKE